MDPFTHAEDLWLKVKDTAFSFTVKEDQLKRILVAVELLCRPLTFVMGKTEVLRDWENFSMYDQGDFLGAYLDVHHCISQLCDYIGYDASGYYRENWIENEAERMSEWASAAGLIASCLSMDHTKYARPLRAYPELIELAGACLHAIATWKLKPEYFDTSEGSYEMYKMGMGFSILEDLHAYAKGHTKENLRLMNRMIEAEYEKAPLQLRGWLFLEESSAERIIKDYLIPNFAPQLREIRTVACNGSDNIKNRFATLNDVFLTPHVIGYYHNKVWIIADGDPSGLGVIEKLKTQYCRGKQPWAEDHFMNWSKHNFEEYYPYVFQNDIEEVLAIKNKQQKRTAKRELLDRVVAWCEQQRESVIRAAFEQSADEVIRKLREIESDLPVSVSP